MNRILALILVLLIATPIIIYLQDPIFWKRYTSLATSVWFEQPRGNWYSPLEAVDGASDEELPHREQSLIPQAVLDDAEAYAADHNSYSFMVWHDGAVVRETYFGDYDANSLIVSKSMAKPLASILVARAFQQGYFDSLDQSAADFITEWQGTDKEAITIRHLLDMSSGLERFYTDTMNPFHLYHQAFLSGKHEEVILNTPIVDQPGSYYDYSQLTSDIIAVLMERATGQPYQDYLSTELLQPLGAAGGDIWVNREGGVAHSGCCIMLPSDTWLRLGVLMAEDGVWQGLRLLPDWWNDEILSGSPANPNYSLYFWLGHPAQERRYFIDPEHLATPGTLQSEPYAAEDLFMFDGNGNQVVYIVPSRKLVVLRTGGWPGKSSDGLEWDNTYLANRLIRAIDSHNGENPVNNNTEKATTGFSSFSDALSRAEPLGLVKGEPQPLKQSGSGAEPSSKNTDFSSAINYAEDMASYSLLIWQGGELLLEKYFDGFDANLRSETASMHKTVLALTIAAAIEDGFINSADDPIGLYIEAWKDRPEGSITLKNLMNMSSGLAPLSSEGDENSPRMRFYFDGESSRQTLLNMELEVEPDSRFLYANTNSQILLIAIEAATKKPYAEYLSERLWQRLGADDAYVWYYEPDGFPRTYASLFARASDWLRTGLLVKDRGQFEGDQIIAAELIDAMTDSSAANVNYGWQIWLGKEYEERRFYNDDKTGFSFASAEPFAVSDMIYFDGIGGQRVYISREEDLVIVRSGDMRMDWDDTHLPNLIVRALNARYDDKQ